MKTLKMEEKTSKTLKPKNELTKSKATKGKSIPLEEDIRKKAHEIYNLRIIEGYFGTPESDWSEAEEYLTINKF
jgi:hypothetical protein